MLRVLEFNIWLANLIKLVGGSITFSSGGGGGGGGFNGAWEGQVHFWTVNIFTQICHVMQNLQTTNQY